MSSILSGFVHVADIQRVELIAAISISLALLIVFARAIRARFFNNETFAEAFVAGQTAAYVFLHLLPDLDTSHHVIGDGIYLVILAGFLFFYGTDVMAAVIDRRAEGHGTAAMFWVRCIAVWLSAFLVVITVPEALHDKATFFVISLLGVSVHISLMAYELSIRHVDLFQQYGRWVLATAPLAAGLLDVSVLTLGELPEDVLAAMLAGLTLLTVFSSRFPEAHPKLFAPMLLGVAIYVAIFLSRPVHVG